MKKEKECPYYWNYECNKPHDDCDVEIEKCPYDEDHPD
jgi:hypothetical protein